MHSAILSRILRGRGEGDRKVKGVQVGQEALNLQVKRYLV